MKIINDEVDNEKVWNSKLTETLWSKKNRTQSTKPKGKAMPTHFDGSSQNFTSQTLPPAGWKAPSNGMGSVSGLEALNLPQYAKPVDAL